MATLRLQNFNGNQKFHPRRLTMDMVFVVQNLKQERKSCMKLLVFHRPSERRTHTTLLTALVFGKHSLP